MILNDFEWFWMILNDFEWLWMTLNDFEWFWMILNDWTESALADGALPSDPIPFNQAETLG